MNWTLINDVLANNGSLGHYNKLKLYRVDEKEVLLTDMHVALFITKNIPIETEKYELEPTGVVSLEGSRKIKEEQYQTNDTVTMAKLKDFLGDPMWPENGSCSKCQLGYKNCPDCSGMGEYECRCFGCDHRRTVSCENCEGTGKVACDCYQLEHVALDASRVVFFDEVTCFDKTHLARMLDFCSDQEYVDIELPTHDRYYFPRIRIKGENWTMVAMGLTHPELNAQGERNTFVWED